MKKLILIPALMALMASGATAQESVLDKMNVDTDAYAWEGTSFYTADIDSIVFYKGAWSFGVPGETYNMIKIFGNGINKRQVLFPVSKIKGIEFTSRDSRKLYSPKFTGEGTDPYNPKGNSIVLKWEPVEGSTGYEIRLVNTARITPMDHFCQWSDEDFAESMAAFPMAYDLIKVPVNEDSIVINDLDYNATYQFGIRAISADEKYNSDWTSRHSIANNKNGIFSIATYPRYNVPKVLSISNRGYDSVRLNFNLSYDAHKDSDPYDEFTKYFEIKDGNFVATEIQITAVSPKTSLDEKWKHYVLTPADIEQGYVDVTGLEEGERYFANIINSNITSIADQPYNELSFYTKEHTEPILVPHVADITTGDYNACDITSVINDYMKDARRDCQVFYLEGGKAYYINSNVTISKGITLETAPEDLAADKRAIVYMGGVTGETGYNFAFASTTEQISPVIFRNIDFDAPQAINFGATAEGVASGTGNYFINSNSPFSLEELTIDGCTFQRMIRGFVRIQKDNSSIETLNCNGNLFYNCGYYDNSGNGYSWFVSPGMVNTNIFSNFKFTNNTIYDSPRKSLIDDSNKSCDWAADHKWNITIENNTFINFSTRASSKLIVNLRYVPTGSHISIQRNLISLAKDEADTRQLHSYGADVRTGEFTFEIKDNYSTGCIDTHMKDNGIFTSATFSGTKNTFGAFTSGNLGTADDLIVKVGTTPLKSTDLFTNPNPPYKQGETKTPDDHKAPTNIMEALKYKQTPEVQNHEIYVKNIGDQRWKK